MIYGYARVSTGGQCLKTQVIQLQQFGCARIFREQKSGATADRPELNRMLEKLADGDLVVICAVDRLSRDTTDLLVLARRMKKVGAGLRSLSEPLVDTTSEFSDLVLAVLGLAAKFERRRILERTTRGREQARANGVRFGRPPKLNFDQRQEAQLRRSGGEEVGSIAKAFRVSPATILRVLHTKE